MVLLAGTVPMATLLVSSNGTITFSLPLNLSACEVVLTSISMGSVTATRTKASGNASNIGQFTVIVEFRVSGVDFSSLQVSSDVLLVLTVLVVASGPCLPSPNFTSVLTYFCTLSALRPSDSLRSSTASTFQSSTAVSSVTGNPMAALSNTGMVSILGLTECIFSDIEQLDNSISPIPVSLGASIGQYYRGAVAVGAAIYLGASVLLVLAPLAMNKFGKRDDGFLLLRFPSSLMLVIGMFHQGMVTCGVSLIRISTSWTDTVIGAVGIGLGLLSTLGVLLAMTVRLACTMVDRVEKEKPLPLENKVPGLATLLKLSVWDKHWADDGTSPGYKRRYLWLLDDLRLPWWAAIELSSGLVQGGILGIRLNEVDACRKQRIAMLVHCIVMFILAAALRPCGSTIGNSFLICAKFCGTMVAGFIMVHTVTTNGAFATGASVVTSIFAFLSTAQAACQLVSALVLGSRSVIPALRTALRKLLAENDNDTSAVNAGGVTSANIRDATNSDEKDGFGDELIEELLHKVVDVDVFIDLLLQGTFPQGSPLPSQGGAKTQSISSHAELPQDADDFLNDILAGIVPDAPSAPDKMAAVVLVRPINNALLVSPSSPLAGMNPFGDVVENKPIVNPFAQQTTSSERDGPPSIALQEASRRSSLGQFMSSGARETGTAELGGTTRRKRSVTSALGARKMPVRGHRVSMRHKAPTPPSAEDDNGEGLDELLLCGPTSKTKQTATNPYQSHRGGNRRGGGNEQMQSMLDIV